MDIVFLGILSTLLIVPETDYMQLKTNKVAGNTKEYIHLDKYMKNQSFALNANLFPSKWKNLEKKTLTFMFYDFPPYNIWFHTKENEGSFQELNSSQSYALEIAGTEGLLTKDFIKRYNISLIVTIGAEWGKNNPESEEIKPGILSSIANHEADFSLAAFLTWYPEVLYVAFSSAIQKSSVSVLVPRPKPLPSWKYLMLPFSLSLWMALFLEIVLGTICFKSIEKILMDLKKGRKLKNHFSDVLISVLGSIIMQSSTMRIKDSVVLLVFGSFLISGLVIGSAYSGGLASVFNVPQ